ncbi:MAG: PrgI family mobile element protein [Clostridia bacterium]
MGTYNIPRNVKGEGRILFIFSTKSLIYSAAGVIIGLPFYFIFSACNMTVVGIVITAFFALIAFITATFKIPELGGIKITKKVGGENIDEVIKRAIRFKKNGNKVYIYTKEEENNG